MIEILVVSVVIAILATLVALNFTRGWKGAAAPSAGTPAIAAARASTSGW